MLTDNFSLKKYNSFGIEAKACYYFSCKTISELRYFLRKNRKKNLPLFVLGGGSNLLFTKDYAGTIIHPLIKGFSIMAEDKKNVLVRVGAGETWDDFVAWAVEKKYYGVENLSLIPGSVGAAAVQNIGAYGVEAKDVISYVNVLKLNFNNQQTYSNKDCRFSYRNSIFKQEMAGKCIVTHVVFKLKKKGEFNLEYGSIREELAKESEISLKTVRKAIIRIRESKLPNPEVIGNAGSFFKNPIISQEHFKEVEAKFPNVVSYPAGEDVKIAAGWLIEALGFKGFSVGGAKVHERQALVITNTGTATATDIIELSEIIKKKVFDTTGITLEPEVIFV